MQFPLIAKDFIVKAAGARTKFDHVIADRWNELHDTGQLRYRLPASSPRFFIGPNATRILILSNPNRFILRRTPITPTRIDEPFSGFSFNKVQPHEIICQLNETATNDSSVIVVNISPFTPLHCLFVPQPLKLYNQYLRKSAFRSAVKCILLSDNLYMCMGFNSLLAHASVNHLHFHIWESPDYLWSMCAELMPKSKVSTYLEIPGHPVDNFARELTALDDLENFIDAMWRVIEACQMRRVAHNLLLTRCRTTGLLRAILWPRRSVYTTKSLSASDSEPAGGYNVAVAELAGMFVVAADNVAERLTQQINLFEVLREEKLPREEVIRLEEILAENNVI